ncbi:MAG: hypothetical protein JW841_03895 [Deltaproteobacteria bacterium]|nr:hypothetical protein [Deltaproteobacteria bacterium]
MNILIYAMIGWLIMTIITALGSRFTIGHLLPDISVVIVVFIAIRREIIPVIITATIIGYFEGQQALAPIGLHEMALTICALFVYLTVGNLAGNGPRFFALTCGGIVMLYHLLLYIIINIFGNAVGFSSWVTSILLPSALVTAMLALIVRPLLMFVERKLYAQQHEELSWH